MCGLMPCVKTRLVLRNNNVDQFPSARAAFHPQPGQHCSFHFAKLDWGERSKTPNQPGQRESDDALRVKRALLQVSDCGRGLEPGSANAGRMRHQCDDRSVVVQDGNAEDETWPYFRRQAKVNQPNLPTRRRFHCACSAWSRARKICSAACVNSSSLGAR